MSLRELVVLGTSSQVPTRHRNHNGYLLRWDGQGLLFDPGEGTQRQMILAGVSATSITRILVTHFHGDHCLGLASIVQRISLDDVPHTIPVHFPASGKHFYERLRHASSFHDVAKLEPRPIERPGVLDEHPELRVSAARLDHTIECFGYRMDEPDRWNVDADKLDAAGITGKAVGALKRDGFVEHGGRRREIAEFGRRRRGQSVAFIMDTRMCDAVFELARDVDLLICESTYLESEATEAHANAHLTAKQAAQIAKDSGARRLVLTHFSQRYHDTGPFVEEASTIHDDVVAAEDGLRIAVPPTLVESDA